MRYFSDVYGQIQWGVVGWGEVLRSRMVFVPEGQHDSSQHEVPGIMGKKTSTVPSGTGPLCIATQAILAWLLSRCPCGTKAIRLNFLCYAGPLTLRCPTLSRASRCTNAQPKANFLTSTVSPILERGPMTIAFNVPPDCWTLATRSANEFCSSGCIGFNAPVWWSH
jgi:hypothetical protein